ncbi:MAG: FAD-dependent oxidoreductase [Deltaproteobacteria bacterium]|nr:FAD-dependent oxidoreductase [Deltaproteobacteria bacterium]
MKVVVVGAGLAGLAAALRLADAGRQVTVLERLSSAGGRARRISGPHGTFLDWGQHLMLGAYRRARGLAERLGTAGRLRFVTEPTPLVTGPSGRHSYGVGDLPAPLHALPALFGLTHLSFFERLALGRPVLGAKLGARLDPAALDRKSALEWLRGHGQSADAIHGFWEPLVVATCNARPAEASAALLAAVIDRGFFAAREDALPLLPDGTLHDVFVGPALDALASRGADVRLGEAAVSLELDGAGRVAAVRSARGDTHPADAVVLAVPPWRAGALLPPVPGCRRIAENAGWLGSSPIVTVEAWFDRPWLSSPFAGLVGADAQWVFAHGPGNVPGAEQRVSIVVSRAQEWVHRTNDEIRRTVLDEVARFFPEAGAARTLASLVVRERQATFLGRPGQAARRPGPRTPIPNLALAGDWTSTGLPATLEGAVQSGETAADSLGATPLEE